MSDTRTKGKQANDAAGDPFDDDQGDDGAAPARRNGTPLPAPNDILFPDSVPTFKFDAVGDEVEGVVTGMRSMQQSDIQTGELLYWDDGRPRMQVEVTLLTGLRDADIEDDDGRRRIFLKSDLQRAVRDAVKHAGKRKIINGATLAVRYTANGTPAKRGLTAPKIYQAVYAVPEQPFADE